MGEMTAVWPLAPSRGHTDPCQASSVLRWKFLTSGSPHHPAQPRFWVDPSLSSAHVAQGGRGILTTISPQLLMATQTLPSAEGLMSTACGL